jgi:hypothetical protein
MKFACAWDYGEENKSCNEHAFSSKVDELLNNEMITSELKSNADVRIS